MARINRHGLEETSRGYLLGVSCNKYHSGNTGLALSHEAYECQGCGAWYSLHEVRELIAEQKGARREG